MEYRSLMAVRWCSLRARPNWAPSPTRRGRSVRRPWPERRVGRPRRSRSAWRRFLCGPVAAGAYGRRTGAPNQLEDLGYSCKTDGRDGRIDIEAVCNGRVRKNGALRPRVEMADALAWPDCLVRRRRKGPPPAPGRRSTLGRQCSSVHRSDSSPWCGLSLSGRVSPHSRTE